LESCSRGENILLGRGGEENICFGIDNRPLNRTNIFFDETEECRQAKILNYSHLLKKLKSSFFSFKAAVKCFILESSWKKSTPLLK
jgi:hypothetical protein